MPSPLENLAPPPRSVPLSLRAAVMNSFGFKAGTVIFALGMILFWDLALPQSWREARFWFAGPLIPAPATVISAEFTRWTRGHGSGGSRFTDGRGTVREGVSYIDGGDVPAPGKQIGIEFAPNRPWVNRVAGGRASPLPFVFNTAAVIPAVGLFLLVSSVREGLRGIRLLADGEVAAGRVLSFRVNPDLPAPKDGDKPIAIEVEVEFLTPTGRRVTVKQRAVDRATEILGRVTGIGDEAEEPILYDPSHPETAELVDNLPGRVGPNGHWQAAGVRPLVVFGILMLTHVSHIVMAVVILGGEH